MWTTITGLFGAISGLAPHVLHHIGPLVGTAVVAGAGGTALFAAIGFVASIPMLWRLKKRFGSWLAPAVALVIFAAMFSLSTFVIGPAISGGNEAPPTTVTSADHEAHHE